MRIKGYLMNSNSDDWLTFVQNIMTMANQLGEELTLSGIYPAFEIISNNNETIKQALIDQFLPLAQFTTKSKGDIGYHHTTASILPRLNEFLYD